MYVCMLIHLFIYIYIYIVFSFYFHVYNVDRHVYFWKCNFPMNPLFCQLVGWFVFQSVKFRYKNARKLYFMAAFRALLPLDFYAFFKLVHTCLLSRPFKYSARPYQLTTPGWSHFWNRRKLQ